MAAEVCNRPSHPYSRALLQTAPVPDPIEHRRRRANLAVLRSRGPVADVGNSCAFADRCPHVIDLCRSVRPEPEKTRGGADVACHRWRELHTYQAVTPPMAPARVHRRSDGG
ncbi:oligopeptide/dipeptide ABC transporter ATP-binding protein [Candidatus Nephthysia bennettiae]|uniref:Oligopeptide/dipeptide ABC transporter C-terminal domain-containing protein n=1 Tax=Candidatus Nephthysia bennettiae TaxID=3127016 RepID=A0A934K5V7_9BACT|nr:hypothetical protein [Candidatus Dormibacteraeota bacterium]